MLLLFKFEPDLLRHYKIHYKKTHMSPGPNYRVLVPKDCVVVYLISGCSDGRSAVESHRHMIFILMAELLV